MKKNKMKKNLPNEIIDWSGVILILVAYGLMSFGVLSSNSLIYQGINVVGALAIAITSIKKKDYEPGILNIIWAVIALIAIINIIK
jgi:hypothetical protein